jgi:hypothetical protein
MHVKGEAVSAHDGLTKKPVNIADINTNGTAATIHILFIALSLTLFRTLEFRRRLPPSGCS